jgi:hypothetical protein
VHLHLEHRIDAPLDAVVRASLDPAFEAALNDLPNVAERTVTERQDGPDGSIHRVVRYRFAGPIPAPALKAIGGAIISWDEIGDYDPNNHEWRFEIRPHIFPGRITCNGRYCFVRDGDATVRAVDADMKVNVPLVGGRVEKALAQGLRDNMSAEAELLGRYVKLDR